MNIELDKKITLNILNEVNNLIENMELIHKELVHYLEAGLLLNDKVIDIDKLDLIEKENLNIKQELVDEIIPKIEEYNCNL